MKRTLLIAAVGVAAIGGGVVVSAVILVGVVEVLRRSK